MSAGRPAAADLEALLSGSGLLSGTNAFATIADFTIPMAAGVPGGAPAAGTLPLACDPTAVTGGFYFWNGAAWVKVATIL